MIASLQSNLRRNSGKVRHIKQHDFKNKKQHVQDDSETKTRDDSDSRRD